MYPRQIVQRIIFFVCAEAAHPTVSFLDIFFERGGELNGGSTVLHYGQRSAIYNASHSRYHTVPIITYFKTGQLQVNFPTVNIITCIVDFFFHPFRYGLPTAITQFPADPITRPSRSLSPKSGISTTLPNLTAYHATNSGLILAKYSHTRGQDPVRYVRYSKRSC